MAFSAVSPVRSARSATANRPSPMQSIPVNRVDGNIQQGTRLQLGHEIAEGILREIKTANFKIIPVRKAGRQLQAGEGHMMGYGPAEQVCREYTEKMESQNA